MKNVRNFLFTYHDVPLDNFLQLVENIHRCPSTNLNGKIWYKFPYLSLCLCTAQSFRQVLDLSIDWRFHQIQDQLDRRLKFFLINL